MKTVLLILVLLLGCGPHQTEDINALWRDVALPCVQLASTTRGGTGSGVVVHQNADRSLIVTAAHVVMGSEAAILARRDSVMMVGAVIRMDVGVDLALVRAPRGWPRVARLPTDDVRLRWGDHVVAFGHPLGEYEGVLTEGRITSLNDNGYLRYSAPTFYGNSGGGVFVLIDDCWTLISVSLRLGGGTGPMGERMPYVALGQGARPDKLMSFLEGIADVR